MKKVCLQCMIGDSDYWTISSHNLYLKSRLPIPEFSLIQESNKNMAWQYYYNKVDFKAKYD